MDNNEICGNAAHEDYCCARAMEYKLVMADANTRGRFNFGIDTMNRCVVARRVKMDKNGSVTESLSKVIPINYCPFCGKDLRR